MSLTVHSPVKVNRSPLLGKSNVLTEFCSFPSICSLVAHKIKKVILADERVWNPCQRCRSRCDVLSAVYRELHLGGVFLYRDVALGSIFIYHFESGVESHRKNGNIVVPLGEALACRLEGC